MWQGFRRIQDLISGMRGAASKSTHLDSESSAGTDGETLKDAGIFGVHVCKAEVLKTKSCVFVSSEKNSSIQINKKNSTEKYAITTMRISIRARLRPRQSRDPREKGWKASLCHLRCGLNSNYI